MGWTVLYTAFGIVALWLLGEVLLQYKARLRWRLLAFAGFSTVVVGVVVLSSVVVIALGAMAFAAGQTFVTLSYRRGFSTGWALGGMPGSSRRRRDGAEEVDGEDADPVLEVSGVEAPGYEAGYETPGYEAGYEAPDHGMPDYDDVYRAEPGGPAHQPPAYEPQPLPDDTGEYGVYDRGGPLPYEPAAAHQAPADPYGYGYGQEDQHQYAPYSDPYVGYDPGQYAASASYDPYGGYGGGYAPQEGYAPHDGYAGAGYGTGQDLYGGAWVPQQRDSDPPMPPEQPYPYQDPYGAGGWNGGYGAGGYGEAGYAAQDGYGYPYAEAGYPADGGYGGGYDAPAQAYDASGYGYGYRYDDQHGY